MHQAKGFENEKDNSKLQPSTAPTDPHAHIEYSTLYVSLPSRIASLL